MIFWERHCQVEQEGWTPEHDDGHADESLRRAALCYARLELGGGWGVPEDWPWEPEAWKPRDDITCLVKAGALLAAEIDRLQRERNSKPDRLQAQHSPEEGDCTCDNGWTRIGKRSWVACVACHPERVGQGRSEPPECDGSGERHGGTPIHAGGNGEWIEDCPGCENCQPTDTTSQPDVVSVSDQLVAAVLRARGGLPEGCRVDLSTPEAAMIRCDLEAVAAYLPASEGEDGDWPGETIAVCQHPNGEGVWWHLNAAEDGSTCIQDCDCKPRRYIPAPDTEEGS